MRYKLYEQVGWHVDAEARTPLQKCIFSQVQGQVQGQVWVQVRDEMKVAVNHKIRNILKDAFEEYHDNKAVN